jgi:hypothetical protein
METRVFLSASTALFIDPVPQISRAGTTAPSSIPPAPHSQPRGAQGWAGTSSVCYMHAQLR